MPESSAEQPTSSVEPVTTAPDSKPEATASVGTLITPDNNAEAKPKTQENKVPIVAPAIGATADLLEAAIPGGSTLEKHEPAISEPVKTTISYVEDKQANVANSGNVTPTPEVQVSTPEIKPANVAPDTASSIATTVLKIGNAAVEAVSNLFHRKQQV